MTNILNKALQNAPVPYGACTLSSREPPAQPQQHKPLTQEKASRLSPPSIGRLWLLGDGKRRALQRRGGAGKALPRPAALPRPRRSAGAWEKGAHVSTHDPLGACPLPGPARTRGAPQAPGSAGEPRRAEPSPAQPRRYLRPRPRRARRYPPRPTPRPRRGGGARAPPTCCGRREEEREEERAEEEGRGSRASPAGSAARPGPAGLRPRRARPAPPPLAARLPGDLQRHLPRSGRPGRAAPPARGPRSARLKPGPSGRRSLPG